MKKLIILLLTSLTMFGCGLGGVKHDPNAPKIDGIGEFKFGASVELLEELAGGMGIPVVEGYDKVSAIVSGRLYAFGDSDLHYRIIEIKPSVWDQNKTSRLLYFNDEVRVFHVPAYRLTESITLEHIEVYFLRDSLYEIQFPFNRLLADALTAKYGMTKLKKEDDTQYGEWSTGDDNVTCMSCVGKYVNYIRIYQHDKNSEVIIKEFDLETERRNKAREQIMDVI